MCVCMLSRLREREKKSYYTVKLLFGVYYGAWLSGEWRGRENKERALTLTHFTHTQRTIWKKRPPQKKKKPQGNITPITDQNGLEINKKTDELSDLSIKIKKRNIQKAWSARDRSTHLVILGKRNIIWEKILNLNGDSTWYTIYHVP